MTRKILLAILLVVAGPALAESELEGSPIHQSPLRIVPAPSLKPAKPAADADHAPVPSDKQVVPKKPSRKGEP